MLCIVTHLRQDKPRPMYQRRRNILHVMRNQQKRKHVPAEYDSRTAKAEKIPASCIEYLQNVGTFNPPRIRRNV